MSTIPGFNALMAQAYNNPTTDIENQQRRAQINALQTQQQQTQALTGLTQQQTRAAALENQIRERDLNDARIERSIFTDAGNAMANPPSAGSQPGAAPNSIAPSAVPSMSSAYGNRPGSSQTGSAPMVNYFSDPASYYQEMIRRGASPTGAAAGAQHLTTLGTNIAKLTTDQADAELKKLGIVKNSLQGYLQNPTPDVYQQFYKDAVRREPGFGHELPMPANGLAPTQNDLAHVISKTGLFEQILQDQKTKAETGKATSEAEEAQVRTATAKRNQALQELSGVLDAPSYADWAERNKGAVPGMPVAYNPTWVARQVRSAVPAAQQPEFDLKSAQARALQAYANMKPDQLDAEVDNIVPRGDPMNASTKVMLHSAAARGDLPAIQQVLKDAYDQRGRVQVAKETKQNQINLDLGAVNTPQSEATAQAIAHYQQAPLASFAMARPQGAALMGRVMEINPDYHAEYYANFNKTEMDATTGKIGTAANALSTMMGHLSVLNEAANGLKNSDVQALNRIANFIGVQIGQTPVTTYNTIVHRLGPEVTKAYLASGGSVGERGTNEEDFDSRLGPDQIKQNIGVSALLADSKIKALQDQYNRGTYGYGKQKLISDEAESARQRLTGQAPGNLRSGGNAGPAPGAKTYTQADVNAAAAQYHMSAAEIEQAFQQKGWRRGQ